MLTALPDAEDLIQGHFGSLGFLISHRVDGCEYAVSIDDLARARVLIHQRIDEIIVTEIQTEQFFVFVIHDIFLLNHE